MKKDEIGFGIVGILLGLFIGFFVANWTWKPPANAPATPGSASPQTSVNSGDTPQLPAGHPTVDPNNPTPARPLTPEEQARGTTSPTTPVGGVELPSLDPLPASSTEERAEKKYKNIQLLKGLPSERINKIMFAFKDSLGVECTYCHIPDHFEKDDKPTKQTARKMIALVRETNAKLGSTGRVSCFTCHRGQAKPAE
ncbi:MAG: photosynthetic reaction center cytochrome c subunit family protein [Acidobacteriota bacterium]